MPSSSTSDLIFPFALFTVLGLIFGKAWAIMFLTAIALLISIEVYDFFKERRRAAKCNLDK